MIMTNEILPMGREGGTSTNNNVGVNENSTTTEMLTPIRIAQIRDTTATPVKYHEKEDTGRRTSPRRAENMWKS